MAKLRDILEENDISIYRVCKLLGLDSGSHTRTRNMLNGEVAIKYEKLVGLCNSLSDYLHKPINVEDIDIDIVKVRV